MTPAVGAEVVGGADGGAGDVAPGEGASLVDGAAVGDVVVGMAVGAGGAVGVATAPEQPDARKRTSADSRRVRLIDMDAILKQIMVWLRPDRHGAARDIDTSVNVIDALLDF